MEYVLAGCIAVVFLIVLALIRSVRENDALLCKLEERLVPSRPEEQERSAQSSQTMDGGIPPEIVAAISAAVVCMYPGARIKSLRRASQKPRSAWQMAGLLENTRPF